MTDNLTREQRSYCMSRVRNRDTDLEILVRSILHRRGLRFRKNVKELPGSPDIAFMTNKVAVFIDGDFWHGYRFPSWRQGLSEFWQVKIDANRRRDKRSHRALRQRGWTVIRLWQHEIRRDIEACVDKVNSGILRAQRRSEVKQLSTRPQSGRCGGRDGR